MARQRNRPKKNDAGRRERTSLPDDEPQRLPPNPQPRRRGLLMLAIAAFATWLSYLLYVVSTRSG